MGLGCGAVEHDEADDSSQSPRGRVARSRCTFASVVDSYSPLG